MPSSLMAHLEELAQVCALFADHPPSRHEQIQSAPATYPGTPAVDGELAKAIYLLDHFDGSREYFQDKAGKAVVFLTHNESANSDKCSLQISVWSL